MNLSYKPHTLYEGTRIGCVFPVTCLKQVQEVLQADPQLIHWGLDDDDELLDVLMTSVLTNKQNRVVTPRKIDAP